MNLKILLFLSSIFCSLINHVHSKYSYSYDILHTDSEFTKVCQLTDGGVLATSSIRGQQKIKITEFEKDATVRYGNSTLNYGYSQSAQLVQHKSQADEEEEDYLLVGHNRQDLSNKEAKENIIYFGDLATFKSKTTIQNKIFETVSVVPLANGKVFIAGIYPISYDDEETKIEINIFDPTKD